MKLLVCYSYSYTLDLSNLINVDLTLTVIFISEKFTFESIEKNGNGVRENY